MPSPLNRKNMKKYQEPQVKFILAGWLTTDSGVVIGASGALDGDKAPAHNDIRATPSAAPVRTGM